MNISELEIGTIVSINRIPFRYNGQIRIGFLGTYTLQHEFINVENEKEKKFFSVKGDTKLEPSIGKYEFQINC